MLPIPSMPKSDLGKSLVYGIIAGGAAYMAGSFVSTIDNPFLRGLVDGNVRDAAYFAKDYAQAIGAGVSLYSMHNGAAAQDKSTGAKTLEYLVSAGLGAMVGANVGEHMFDSKTPEVKEAYRSINTVVDNNLYRAFTSTFGNKFGGFIASLLKGKGAVGGVIGTGLGTFYAYIERGTSNSLDQLKEAGKTGALTTLGILGATTLYQLFGGNISPEANGVISAIDQNALTIGAAAAGYTFKKHSGDGGIVDKLTAATLWSIVGYNLGSWASGTNSLGAAQDAYNGISSSISNSVNGTGMWALLKAKGAVGAGLGAVGGLIFGTNKNVPAENPQTPPTQQ